MGNVAKYQHGWNMTFTVVELLMIIPKSTYLSISLPYFSIYHFFSLTLYEDYTNPGHAAPIITTEDGKVSDNEGYRPYVAYRHFDSPEEIFKHKDARFFACITYPNSVWKGKKIVIQGG